MPVKEQKRNHIGLDVGQLDDQGLSDVVSAILQSAPSSALYKASPAIQASVAALGVLSSSHQTASDAVIADRTKLETDMQLESDARFAMVNGVVQLKGMVETSAPTAADIKGMGFNNLVRQSAGAVEVPGVAIYVPKRERGRAKVSATLVGSIKGCRFAAQCCLDPLAQNTWTDLQGDGRTHWLAFNSGTVVWVRFRSMRGHATSGWSAPVSVTIP